MQYAFGAALKNSLKSQNRLLNRLAYFAHGAPKKDYTTTKL
mgnify:CR=1 FL=1